jgi:hypothetical protein
MVAKAKTARGRATLEKRVDAFRTLVFAGLRKAAQHGHSFKTYEGAVQLHWPPFVHARSGTGRYSLHLSCSVLGGETNHYAWRGRTWSEVFRKATNDVAFWISEINGGSHAP